MGEKKKEVKKNPIHAVAVVVFVVVLVVAAIFHVLHVLPSYSLIAVSQGSSPPRDDLPTASEDKFPLLVKHSLTWLRIRHIFTYSKNNSFLGPITPLRLYCRRLRSVAVVAGRTRNRERRLGLWRDGGGGDDDDGEAFLRVIFYERLQKLELHVPVNQ
jgi:hypothetical protein